MRWAFTTVTYRYHLLTLAAIADNARACGFTAIELWEPHYIRHAAEIETYRQRDDALPIHVLSGYSDVTGTRMTTRRWSEELSEKLRVCRKLDIPYLRLFTGTIPSSEAETADWSRFITRTALAQELAEKYECGIVFETHPGTLLDSVDSIERFLTCIDRHSLNRIGLNFDIYHVWECGTDPAARFREWYPHIKHIHLKSARRKTPQFAFMNVYHPTGRYDDLCAIRDGVYDVRPILEHLKEQQYDGALTLEWFGMPDHLFFAQELDYLKRITHSKEICV